MSALGDRITQMDEMLVENHKLLTQQEKRLVETHEKAKNSWGLFPGVLKDEKSYNDTISNGLNLPARPPVQDRSAGI